MKNIIKTLLVMTVIAIGTSTIAYATPDKKEKKKKDKKEWVWEMPELTGNADFDEYLLSCDTMNTRLNTYADDIVWYSVKKIACTDANGNVLKDTAGNDSIILAVVDNDNNIRGTGEAITQYTQTILTGMDILTDAVCITALTASATASLPSLGLKALSYGKYIQAGPRLTSKITSSVKEIVNRMKVQRTAIREYKKNYTEQGVLVDPTMSPENIEGLNYAEMETIQKNVDEVNSALAAAAANDKNFNVPDADEDIDIDAI